MLGVRHVDQPLTDEAGEERHARFRVGGRSAAYVREMWGSIGATIQGWRPEADVPFHDDVAAAVEDAKQRAGDRVVALCAGNVGGQALALGLVDEVAMDVVPVVFGTGKRFFGPVDSQQLLEDPHVVLPGDRVLHLRYRAPGNPC